MATRSGADAAPRMSAAEAARVAATRAGVTMRSLDDLEGAAQASALAARVWRSADSSALDSALLRALAHSGNFVVGAFDGTDMVGMSVGFRTGVPEAGLHSHMTCTDDEHRGVGLGYALKLHQRAWALDHGLRAITWTFDPLVGRNARFNLGKLGVSVEAYLPNFYGAMTDGLNAGDESDRLLVRWDLLSREPEGPADEFALVDGAVRLVVGADGEPLRLRAEADSVGCEVPRDIVEMRAAQPQLALRWRHELRAALQDAFADGYRVVGFSRSGCYVLARGDHPRGTAAVGG